MLAPWHFKRLILLHLTQGKRYETTMRLKSANRVSALSAIQEDNDSPLKKDCRFHLFVKIFSAAIDKQKVWLQ